MLLNYETQHSGLEVVTRIFKLWEVDLNHRSSAYETDEITRLLDPTVRHIRIELMNAAWKAAMLPLALMTQIITSL